MSDDQNTLNPNQSNTDDASVADPTTPASIAAQNTPISSNQDIPANTEESQYAGLSENDQTTNSVSDIPGDSNQFNQDEIITAPHAPKKYGGNKVIATIFGLLILIGGVTAGVILVQRQQQLEEKAASGKECEQAADCILLDEPGNKGEFSAPGIITKADITAKDYITFMPGYTDDGCYKVNIDGRNITWERYGSGPNCKNVSNVQVKFKGSMEFIKICHYTSDPSAHPWQAIEISQQAWDMGHDDAHDFKKTQYDFPYTNTDPNCQWPEPGNQGITCADLWCENNAPPTITPDPTDKPQVKAECSEVIAYSTTWELLSNENLNQLSEGDKIRFSVFGSSSSGTFDKARFSVNSISLGETTLKKPGSDEFYIEYAIPAGTTDFTVDAEIHHTELGWF